MSTTNILDLNNRIDELANSYPASKVILNSGDSVEEKIGNMRMAKLWENPNPTAEFASQTITLSSSDYDLLLVLYKPSNNGTRICSQITTKGMGSTLDLAEGSDNAASCRNRYFTYVSVTSYSISNARINGTDNNTLIIPYQIYGIKLT